MLSTQLANILRKRRALETWLHLSGLILLKTAYRKRGELLWAIRSSNFINLHSAAFTVFARYLVHAYKFLIIQKTAG